MASLEMEIDCELMATSVRLSFDEQTIPKLLLKSKVNHVIIQRRI